ncbi:hypothetical protein KBD71_03815 [Candidatus Woesebacteria bacterium]|nr:hypothetical protein [Candidatus Woesebacteria bacterium]
MKLPFLGSSQPVHSVYSIAISSGVVWASVWHAQGAEIKVDSISEPIEWDSNDEETLLEAVDTAIADFPAAAEILFALPDDWVNGQGIAQTKKPLLRTLTQKLELHSVGFVVTAEAVIARLTEQSTTPFSAVCVFVEEQSFVVSCVRHGQSSSLIRVGRSGESVNDLMEAFSRLKATDLPSLLVLSTLSASEEELQELANEITSNNWNPSLFQQLPKIMHIEPKQVIIAVSQTGGKEVAKVLGIASETVEVAKTPPSFTPVVAPNNEEEEQSQEEDLVHDDDTDLGRTSLLSRLPKPVLVGGVILLLLGVAGALASFLFLPSITKATVTITSKANQLSTSQIVVLDPKAEAPSESTLPVSLSSTQVTGSKEVPTTGKKTVGDKAKGTLTIYNKTSQAKSFSAGTILKFGKLSFVTDDEVTVASASSTISETVHGKATVKATASAPGEESNIGSNQELVVGTYDQSAFIAKTETAFIGGNSKSVTSVTQKDQDEAVKALTVDLKEQAKEAVKLTANEVQEVVVLDDLVVTSKTFTQPVGAEATSVSVTMNASASGLLYTKGQMQSFAKEKLQNQAAGQTLVEPSVTVEVTGQKLLGKQQVELTLALSGQSKSTVDPTSIAKILAGKNLEESKAFLDSQESIASYTITTSPSFLRVFTSKIPKNIENIAVTVD